MQPKQKLKGRRDKDQVAVPYPLSRPEKTQDSTCLYDKLPTFTFFFLADVLDIEVRLTDDTTATPLPPRHLQYLLVGI